MGLPDLYPAQVGSPYTTLAAPYMPGGTTMTVVDATKLPDAPNIVCLAGSVSGEFRYSGKDGNVLLGVVKLPGTPNTTWPVGTYAFRGISAYDHASIVEHLTYQRSHIVEASLDLTTDLTYSGRVLEGAEAGENLAFGDLAVLAESGKFMKANPATLATLDGTIALVVSGTIAAGSQGMFLLRGLIRKDSWTFSQGKELYASSGTLTHEPPTTGTQIIRKVGTALTATIIEFNPSSTLHAEYLVSVLPVNTVTKDNGDVERKFWKDDFSVDSSSQYTGDVASFTWDTANSRLEIANVGQRTLAVNNCQSLASTKISFVISVPSGTDGQNGVNFTTNGVQYTCRFITVSRRLYLYQGGSSLVFTSQFPEGWDASIPVIGVITLNPSSIDIDAYVEGVKYSASYGATTTGASDLGIFAYNPTSTGYFHDLTAYPSVSYADDFASDTTERYQAVTGTVAYDDVNKRMNVTTATGANGKASGRLKSYKFCEGSQIYDVLLPTGADGDFICMVTHATNGVMDNGIGVGLQSDGAGNWNLATLSGTTVTEGADSGLNDADVARIEIEKDITGAYWYYIYDASGTKPTTATGKLFTTLSEGYTGWYANGAGATTQTYAIENISIRAESIVGRTNVEVTEPFWFRDEFGEDSIGRLTGNISSFTVTGGKLTCASEWKFVTVPCAKLKDQTVSLTWKPTSQNVDGRYRLAIAFRGSPTSTAALFGSEAPDIRKIIYIMADLNIVDLYTAIPNDTASECDSRALTVTYNVEHAITVTKTGTTYILNVDGTEVTLVDDSGNPDLESSYISIEIHNCGATPHEIDNLQISGTRVYNKPIHRGAMLETYHDGTQEVVGTTFIDDCQWDTREEWRDISGTLSYDAVSGTLSLSGGTGSRARIPDLNLVEGVYEAEISYEWSTKPTILIGTINLSDDYGIGVVIDGGGADKIGAYKGGAGWWQVNATGIRSIAPGNRYKIKIEFMSPSVIKVYVADAGSEYPLSPQLTVNLTTRPPLNPFGKPGISLIVAGGSGVKFNIHKLIINALSTDSPNGIAACIPPIGGGARYGVEESVYIPITPGTEIPVGTAVISPNAKSTVVGTALTTFAQTPAGVSASLEYATGTKACPGLSDALAPTGRHRVKADRNTLTNIGVKGSATGTSPAVYIDSLHVRRQEVA